MRTFAVSALTLVWVSACSRASAGDVARVPETPDSAGTEVVSDALPTADQLSDSAGVRVVTNPAPKPNDPRFELSEKPLASIGVAEGAPAYQLFRANQALLLSDGTIVVANAGTQELRFYDKTGKYLGAGGKKGEGPGEFGGNGFELVGSYRGDSLVTEDRMLNRFSVFDKTGKFGRSYKIPGSLGYLPSPGGVLADGRIIALNDFIGPGRGFGEKNPRLRLPVNVFVISSDGSSKESVGEFPGPEGSVGQYAVAPVYFGRDLHAKARGDRIAVGNTDAYSVRIYDGAGKLLQIVRQTRTPVPVQDGDWEKMTPEGLKPGGAAANTQMGRNVIPLIEQMYRYTTFPAFGGEIQVIAGSDAIRLDEAGDLWVEEYRMNRELPDAWQAFSPAGAFLGRLELPAKSTLLDVGTDYALIKVIDELDVEHVVLYGLQLGP
jgi:hypothetical protein